MSTTIRSTELDFQTIKENLKTYLKGTGEFNDYDFEASGISNILDVLAYNTHYNALEANFALNESFLVTAQLRPSVVSLAESLGYVPDSKKSSEIPISFSANLIGVPGTLENYTLQPGELVLRGERDDRDYTFTNRVALKANRSDGIYTFFPSASPDEPVIVYEGEKRKSQFIVGNSSDDVYVIPDTDIDTSTAIVKVYENQGSAITENAEFSVYTNLLNASNISSLSRLYVLRESPNGFYEVSFGNGTSLGISPDAGNVVEVEYLRANGEIANGISTLTLTSSISLGGIEVDPDNVTISSSARSSGGGEKEGIESIRKNAPFQFAAQNRMVTADDYSTLILKKYSAFIEDIQSWGGEDNPEPDFGTVFTSIVWQEDLPSTTISNTRQGILSLSDQFQIASFSLTFVDPVVTYISTEVFFQFNPALSGLSAATIRESVENSVNNYFEENTGKFSQVFRQSNMLTAVDATDPSVLSSRANVILSRRIVPQLGTTKDYDIYFPSNIRDPEVSSDQTVYTSSFNYENEEAYIRNKLNQRVIISEEGASPVVFEEVPTTTLEMVRSSDGEVIIDNIGSYDTSTGRVTINSLRVQSIPSSINYIKVFAVPANQSVINSVRNNIIRYDAEESFNQEIIVDTR